MPLPNHPVTLTAEEVATLNKKLSTMRHEVNNNLSLIIAAAEIMRLQPERSGEMGRRLAEKPHNVAAAVTEFSRELEKVLGIGRP